MPQRFKSFNWILFVHVIGNETDDIKFRPSYYKEVSCSAVFNILRVTATNTYNLYMKNQTDLILLQDFSLLFSFLFLVDTANQSFL